MGNRTSQLQIRVTPDEKAALKRLAAAAGESVSSYVLTRVLPSRELELATLYRSLSETGVDHRATLAAVERLLSDLDGSELRERVPPPEAETVSPVLLNCLAAIVETVAHRTQSDPPAWVAAVPPLPRPHFGWSLGSLRPHQLRVSPIPFKRRNIFFDPAVGPSP